MMQWIYFIGRSVCHQIPERSFFIGNHQLPLCARCTGIYMGVFLGFLYLFSRKRWKGNKPPSLKILLFILLSWIPMMIDGATSYIGLRASNNIARLITGFLFGVFWPVFILLLKNYQVMKGNNLSIVENYKDLIIMICALIPFAGIFSMQSIVVWWSISGITVGTLIYVYVQMIFIIIRNLLVSMNKKIIYFISFIISMMIMSGLSWLNDFLLAQYR
ncbi:DUF2085 domain-containing protein [Defluviitalea raffinosedens]|uniref:DUF2085 domain-containing protein n=1 Tax=Defluviitalea raffinosedens TaxID=1450156 RepID=UPI001957495C|nr:DUF2085 domain-containing protein [Defluviitalea raffinosedens]MBM7686406.1 putative membrane protein [Defluviitalea raffinosedens]